MDDEHLQEETLEHYLLGYLPPSRLDAVEEHLTLCHHCQDRAEKLADFIRAMRQATERKPN